MAERTFRRFWTPGRLSTAIGLLAGLAVVLTLDGPGITIDEPLDVRPGRTYLSTLFSQGWGFFRPEVVDRVFRDNAEHPPLGRWLLGIASTLGEPIEVVLAGGRDPIGLYLLAGRLAPALTFAALVGLVAFVTGRRYGNAAGISAGFGLLAMPRVFAHAHLGALDTFIAFFWTLALLASARALDARHPTLAMVGAGVLWGLALLTKIHAWFLPPILLVWAVARYRKPWVFPPLLAWLATGIATFALGWPWLWYHTLERLAAYWGTGVERTSIFVQYFGQVYADRDVPWHYPWFYFAVTVPVGLHALGLLGLALAWRERRADPALLLPAGSIVFFLTLFSTRIPVYDGERLFLMVFPLWALLIGRGFQSAWHWTSARRIARVGLVGVFVAQGVGTLLVHPFGLSYYNALVGGLRGAERLGLELTFWNDAVDPVLLARLAAEAKPDASAALAPTLYPGQGLASTTRAMARLPVILRDEDAALRAQWVVVSRRSAYWKPELRRRLEHGRRVAVRERQGVWLSALWTFPTEANPPSRPTHPEASSSKPSYPH